MALENLQQAVYEMLFDRKRRNSFFQGEYDLGATYSLTPAEVEQVRNVSLRTFERYGIERIRRMPKCFPFANRIVQDYFKDPIEINFLFGESELFKQHVNDCDQRFEEIFYNFLLQEADAHKDFNFLAFKQILQFEYAKWKLEVSGKNSSTEISIEVQLDDLEEQKADLLWHLSDQVRLFQADVDVIDILSHMMNYINEADSVHVTGTWLKKRKSQQTLHTEFFAVLLKDWNKKVKQYRIGKKEFTVLKALAEEPRTLDEIARITDLPTEHASEILTSFMKVRFIRPKAGSLV